MHALRLLKAIILSAPPRSIFLQPRYKAPTLLYTDASFKDLAKNTPAHILGRLGIVIFSERLRRPLGLTVAITEDVLRALKVRKQQITQLETLAAPVALWEVPDLFQDQDLIWFLDNQGAEAGLIKGYSGEEDSAAMIGPTHIHLAHLNARVWFDYVYSEVNPSDGLSRAGLLDEWSRAQSWDLFEVAMPDLSGLVGLPLDEILRVFSQDLSRVPSPNIRDAPVSWVAPDVSATAAKLEFNRDSQSLAHPERHDRLL